MSEIGSIPASGVSSTRENPWIMTSRKWSFVHLTISSLLLVTATAVDFSLQVGQTGLSVATITGALASTLLFFLGWYSKRCVYLKFSLLVQMVQIFFLIVCIAIFAFFKAVYPSVDQTTLRLCSRCEDPSKPGLQLFTASECRELCLSAAKLAHWPEWVDTRLSLMIASVVPLGFAAFHSRETWLKESGLQLDAERKKVDSTKPSTTHRTAALAIDDFTFARRASAGGWARRRATTAIPQLLESERRRSSVNN